MQIYSLPNSNVYLMVACHFQNDHFGKNTFIHKTETAAPYTMNGAGSQAPVADPLKIRQQCPTSHQVGDAVLLTPVRLTPCSCKILEFSTV